MMYFIETKQKNVLWKSAIFVEKLRWRVLIFSFFSEQDCVTLLLYRETERLSVLQVRLRKIKNETPLAPKANQGFPLMSDTDDKPIFGNTPEELLVYAKKLLGKTFSEVLRESEISSRLAENYKQKGKKGNFGDILQEVYFGVPKNSRSEADFSVLGIELKVTPCEELGNGNLRAGERLVLSMIAHDKPIDSKKLEQSHFWEKCARLLIIYYLRDKKLIDELLYPIKFVELFTPSEVDLVIIRKDYLLITRKIEAGLAHTISEGDTIYLGACTKGATSQKSLRPQYYEHEGKRLPAKTRAWCYKQSYMTYVLRNYFSKKKDETEGPIFSNQNMFLLRNRTFSQALEEITAPYIGKTSHELCCEFGVQAKAKNLYHMLASRMLTNGKDKVVEFEKGGVTIKTIRLEQNGKIREAFRFNDVDFEEVDKAPSFDESKLSEFLESTLFYIVVFQNDGKDYVFKTAFLWHLPIEEMDRVKKDFKELQTVIREGIHFDVVQWANGPRVLNNLPKSKDTNILHVRTHAQNSYYIFDDGRGAIGKGNISDTVPVPHTGHRCTRHSYWLNKAYILSVVKEHLTKCDITKV